MISANFLEIMIRVQSLFYKVCSLVASSIDFKFEDALAIWGRLGFQTLEFESLGT